MSIAVLERNVFGGGIKLNIGSNMKSKMLICLFVYFCLCILAVCFVF